MKTAKEWLLEQLKGFENHEDYKDDNIKAIADFMEHYAKYYHEQQVNSVDLADVGGNEAARDHSWIKVHESPRMYRCEKCGKRD